VDNKHNLPNQIRYLLFDLDGTLLDSRKFLVDASYRTLEKYYPGMCTYETIVEQFGMGFNKMLSEFNLKEYEPAKNEFYQIKLEAYHEQSPPFPGVMEGLQALQDAGYKLGVVTNQQKEVVANALAAYGMDRFFAAIIALEDVEQGKPSPEGTLKALQLLGGEQSAAALIGDSKYDVFAAQRAGIAAGLLTWYDDIDAAASKPDLVWSNFGQLLDTFKVGA
jgi:pyrophosphatase PpaX